MEDIQFWKFRHRVLEELVVVWASLFVAKATSITFLTSLCLSLSMSLTVLWILFILKSNVEKVYSNKHTYLLLYTLQNPHGKTRIGSFNEKLDIYISSLVIPYLQQKLLAKTTKMFGNSWGNFLQKKLFVKVVLNFTTNLKIF